MRKLLVTLMVAALVLAWSQHGAEPAQGFANSNHQTLTTEALPFIKQDVMDDINDEHLFDEIAGGLSSAQHFDNCVFSGAAAYINNQYTEARGFLGAGGGAVAELDPDDSQPFDATDEWGQLLHPAQDFYAHSNWVDLGQTTLIDSGLGVWDGLSPYSIHDGAMMVQGENQEPFGAGSLSLTGFVVTVDTGTATYKGVISGTFGTSDDCPDNVAVAHGSLVAPLPHLNKDDTSSSNGTLYPAARALAIRQTRHEFCRLVQLVRDRWGQRGVDGLLEAWVKADATSQTQMHALFVECGLEAAPTPTPTSTSTPPPSVGGIAEVVSGGDSPLSVSDGSPAAPYAALGGGLAAAVLAMAAGGWYARRRWLR